MENAVTSIREESIIEVPIVKDDDSEMTIVFKKKKRKKKEKVKVTCQACTTITTQGGFTEQHCIPIACKLFDKIASGTVK
ncbi:hypothetical protein [Psychrobium sp. 1_MG-2023]|uniref:hypothetical protein n=1 Tax=Psychrobium sp. 1_MG-2023 TaxID=3062624 RepID=UPI000C33F162|nr:hypothetical protein [Psychrobium sp. 1_MG-2023]MDP2559738.1 hypothetical protein [Psychrobium sp. 1_MG-2023]PKF59153.1 hypothetical protein CW748_02900 [Alteromonadales bacterium alter-6D02]